MKTNYWRSLSSASPAIFKANDAKDVAVTSARHLAMPPFLLDEVTNM